MIQVHPEVNDALADGRPVVALESAVATAGLPSSCWASDRLGWDSTAPVCVEAVRAQHRAVRDHGVVPAAVGVLGGVLHVGLDDEQLIRLVTDGASVKAAAGDLAPVMAAGVTAGTTVSGTVQACRCLEPPIRVLATGGIGGVHRGWTSHPDVSADLKALGETPICVVASGPKSVLDVPATFEALESLGIPVVAFGTDRLAEFFTQGRRKARWRVDNAPAVAEICRTHWETLNCRTAVLVAKPVPPAHALDAAEIDRLISVAETDETHGAGRTPHLLAVLHEQTGGRSLDANLALLVSNAGLAAEVAGRLVGAEPPSPP